MVFTGRITHLSQKGLGVVKNEQDGVSYFVFGTWPGDEGEFAIIDRPLNNKKYGYAKLVQLTHPSNVICQHFTGHKVKQHFAATRSQRAIYIH